MQPAICIFCGSRVGANHDWLGMAHQVGQQIVERGWTLVFGGGSGGLMGAVSGGAFEKNGSVTGIIPYNLLNEKPNVEKITNIFYVDTMAQRKQMMINASTVFVVLPGGIGTFDELFAVWTEVQTGFIDKPIIIANWNGYYDGLLRFLENCVTMGMATPKHMERIQVVSGVEDLFIALEALQ